jgi:hypothetical protein
MKKLLLTWKRIMFLLKLKIIKARITTVDNLWTYSLLGDLTFNSDKYWKRYVNGVSIETTIRSFLNTKQASINRKINRLTDPPSEEVLERLDRFIERAKDREFEEMVESYHGEGCFEKEYD